jgi:signal transduction histidine kinase
VRLRLTLLYGGLFLLSGAALMAITYALLVNAGFVFTLGSGTGAPAVTDRSASSVSAFPRVGSTTHPSAQTMAHWRQVASCMRRHGVAGFPDPATSVPTTPAGVRVVSDRDGAILVIPETINMQSPEFVQANAACRFMVPDRGTVVADERRRTHVRQALLIQSGIALAGMSLLSLLLGWLMAGRVLRPLEDSYEAQRQFVANASHELRAPLTRQRALIQVTLADPEAGVPALRAAHERVLASEQDLEEMIDGLLALTRGQAGCERRERLDLAAISSAVVRAREPQLAELGLDVRLALATAPAAGDQRLLERLIANLIDNGIRHNVPGGHVEITTATRDRQVFVSVENTGPPVPPEQIERLLQPFERLGGARTRHSGHGLGLSIVKAIADAHRAELNVRPRPDGGLLIEVALRSDSGTGSAVRARARWTGRAGRAFKTGAPPERGS